MRSWLVAAGSCAVWIAAVACDPAAKDTTDTGATPGAPTFTQVKSEVLPSCTPVCHTGATSAPLVLTAGQEYDAIVNVESVDAPGQILVVPGDADSSYLVAKIEGSVGITGSQMPPPFGGLSADQIQLVRDWIDAGAENN
jgi:hypothetical protein